MGERGYRELAGRGGVREYGACSRYDDGGGGERDLCRRGGDSLHDDRGGDRNLRGGDIGRDTANRNHQANEM